MDLREYTIAYYVKVCTNTIKSFMRLAEEKTFKVKREKILADIFFWDLNASERHLL
jgi:hypothetical protein